MPAAIEAPVGAETDVPAVVESPKENISAVETFDRDLKGFQQLFKEQRDKDKAKAKEEKPTEEKADKPEEPKDKKAEPEKPKKEPAKKEEPKPAAEEPKPVEEEEEERPRPRRRGKERDIEEVAASAASKAAAETAAKMADRKAAKEEPDLELPKDVKYKLKVFDELEAANPEYKGTSAKYRKWLKEVDDHQRKWQSEHPNEDYDPEADEHDALYRKEPTVSEEDYDQARVSLAQKKGGNAEVKKLQEEHQTLKQKLIERELEPKIYNESVRAVTKVLESIDPELAKLMDDPKGLQKLYEEDPIVAGVLSNALTSVLPMLREVVRLYDGEIGVEKDNEAQKDLFQFAHKMEQAILSRPPSKQMLNGREYLPMAEYANLSQADRKHYWSMSERENLANHLVSFAVHTGQEGMKLEEAKGKAYEKRFSKKGQTVATPAQDKKAEPEKPVEDIDESPSPSGTGRSTVDTFGTSKTKEPENFDDIMLRRLHGG